LTDEQTRNGLDSGSSQREMTMPKRGGVIRAIETHYRGCRFRSRLEARWAVFLDHLDVRWEYEKEGYALPSGAYLPDFWLPDLQCWVEIKPEEPTELESKLAQELADFTRKNAFLFYGPVPGFAGGYDSNSGEFFQPFDPESPHDPVNQWADYCFYAFCVCPDCGIVGIEFAGRSDRLPCKGCSHTSRDLGRNYTFDHPRILEAVAAARSARFEHGERGP
jgi:hypothetical protein